MNQKQKDYIWELMEKPRTKVQKFIGYGMNILVLVSITLLYCEFKQPDFFHHNHSVFFVIEMIILFIFVTEFGLSMYTAPSKKNYLKSWNGAFDVLAIFPSLIAVMIGLDAVLPTRFLQAIHSSHIFHVSRFLR